MLRMHIVARAQSRPCPRPGRTSHLVALGAQGPESTAEEGVAPLDALCISQPTIMPPSPPASNDPPRVGTAVDILPDPSKTAKPS